MAKKTRGYTKKGLPGLIRITKRTGSTFKRVWLYRGEEFETLSQIRAKYGYH